MIWPSEVTVPPSDHSPPLIKSSRVNECMFECSCSCQSTPLPVFFLIFHRFTLRESWDPLFSFLSIPRHGHTCTFRRLSFFNRERRDETRCTCNAPAIPAEVCADEQHSCMCVAYRLSPKLAWPRKEPTTNITWLIHLRLKERN